MAFVKKTWKDRIADFIGRRDLIKVSGSLDSILTVDVVRAEGFVPQEGDAFSSENMNDLEQRIADGFSGAVASETVRSIVRVDALPTDAASHPDTLYLVL